MASPNAGAAIGGFLQGFSDTFFRAREGKKQKEEEAHQHRLDALKMILANPDLTKEAKTQLMSDFVAMQKGKKEEHQAWGKIQQMLLPVEQGGGIAPTGKPLEQTSAPGQKAAPTTEGAATRPRQVGGGIPTQEIGPAPRPALTAGAPDSAFQRQSPFMDPVKAAEQQGAKNLAERLPTLEAESRLRRAEIEERATAASKLDQQKATETYDRQRKLLGLRQDGQSSRKLEEVQKALRADMYPDYDSMPPEQQQMVNNLTLRLAGHQLTQTDTLKLDKLKGDVTAQSQRLKDNREKLDNQKKIIDNQIKRTDIAAKAEKNAERRTEIAAQQLMLTTIKTTHIAAAKGMQDAETRVKQLEQDLDKGEIDLEQFEKRKEAIDSDYYHYEGEWNAAVKAAKEHGINLDTVPPPAAATPAPDGKQPGLEKKSGGASSAEQKATEHGPRTVSMSKVRAFAKANGITEEAAKQHYIDTAKTTFGAGATVTFTP